MPILAIFGPFFALFCQFLLFFAIFSCLNTVLHVFAKFYGLLIIISQFLMGCAKMHTPPRNRVISDAPRNRVKDSQSKAILRGFNIAFFYFYCILVSYGMVLDCIFPIISPMIIFPRYFPTIVHTYCDRISW